MLIVVAMFLFIQTGVIFWILKKYAEEQQSIIEELNRQLVETRKALPYIPDELPDESLYGGTYKDGNKHLDTNNGITIEELFSSEYDKGTDEAWKQINELKSSV